MSDRYQKRPRISDKKYREIARYFYEDLTAIQIANIIMLNCKQLTKHNLHT